MSKLSHAAGALYQLETRSGKVWFIRAITPSSLARDKWNFFDKICIRNGERLADWEMSDNQNLTETKGLKI